MTGIRRVGRKSSQTQSEVEDVKVWSSFVRLLQTGAFLSIPIRPYYPMLLEPLQIFLQKRSRDADWHEWETLPEIHRVENRVHYLLDLTVDHATETFCFTFLVEGSDWYFQHAESIILRLDLLDPLPTSRFPDLHETKKVWMSEEIRMTEMVRLFNWLVQERGRDFAFYWFQDGEGYSLAAKTWVPFVPVHQAFILYLCWEQSNLRGSLVTLVELSDEIARVEMDSMYFHLYHRTGHLKQQISFEDYQKLFEATWNDRAEKAGWQVAFALQNALVQMKFQRK